MTHISNLPILPFETSAAWDAWLEENHATSSGLWLKIAKLSSGIPTITYAEAVEGALCFGWIDGQKGSLDDRFWLQRFTRRLPRSKWSQVNCIKAMALVSEGRMRSAGLREIEAAQKDGRWEAAYPSQRGITVPLDLQQALSENLQASSFFADLDSQNRYAILFRIHDAKAPATRARRIEKYVAMLAQKGKLYP